MHKITARIIAFLRRHVGIATVLAVAWNCASTAAYLAYRNWAMVGVNAIFVLVQLFCYFRFVLTNDLYAEIDGEWVLVVEKSPGVYEPSKRQKRIDFVTTWGIGFAVAILYQHFHPGRNSGVVRYSTADPYGITASLIVSAISTGISLGIAQLTKPKPQQQFFAPNDVTRGGYIPIVIGRRQVGVHIGYVGSRVVQGGGKTGYTYTEAGWHQLCHGPMRRLYRIKAGDKVLFDQMLDSTVVANGAQFTTPQGGVFAIYFGADDQPGDEFLNEKLGTKKSDGTLCRFPGLAYIVWYKKNLGSAPVWPQMSYEIECHADDLAAADGLDQTVITSPWWVDESTPATTGDHSVTTWFNGMQPLAAGTYTITYVRGAFKLRGSAGWRVYSPDTDFGCNVVTSSDTVITHTPFTTNITYANQSDAEAANAGATLTFTWPGGPMGIRFGDLFVYPKAVPGIPNPTFTVQASGSPSYQLSIAVQGGAAGSGDSGVNPAAALYLMLCGRFPYGCAIGTQYVDAAALNSMAATLAGERLLVNMLIDEGQQASDAVSGLMADVGFMLPQVGGILKPYLIRTETTVPDMTPLRVGPPPERQRQTGNIGADRYTFTINDVLNDFATSDITVDDDGQASGNGNGNRPQAQAVTLNNITSRTVARRVAIRKAVELVALATKLPAFTMLREARSPMFHPGRTFLMDGVTCRVTGWQPGMDGVTAQIDAIRDQYGDIAFNIEDDNDGSSFVNPSTDPVEPDLDVEPMILPRAWWANPAIPVFGVPRVRANDSVQGASVWISTASSGTYSQVGEQDVAFAGGTLTSAFAATGGTLATGPAIQPYNDDILNVPDLSGDSGDYDAGALLLKCEDELMLLESITANMDGSYTLNNLTRGAFGTTVAAHASGTPAVIITREDLVPITSPLLDAFGSTGGTLWIKTQPTDGNDVVDLSVVTAVPLVIPANLLASITIGAPGGGVTVTIGGTFTIAWRSVSLDGDVSIDYSTDGGTTWVSVTADTANTGTYSWDTTALAAGSYLLRVSSVTTPTVYDVSFPFTVAVAVAGGGGGGIPPTGISPPPAPASLTATAGSTTVDLAWASSSGATGYTVYRSTTIGTGYTSVGTTTSALTFSDTGLTNGTIYYYVVTATSSGGTSSSSSEVPVIPGTPGSATVLDFAGQTSLDTSSTYGSASTNTPNVSVAWGGAVTLWTGSWNSGMGASVFGAGSGLVTITFTPAAGRSVTINSFDAGRYGSAAGWEFSTMKIVDGSGNVLWQPSPIPSINNSATAVSPAYTSPAGVPIILQFQDNDSDGEAAITNISFSQTPA